MCTATSGNGCRTAGRPTAVRLLTAPHGQLESIVVAGFSAAVPGPTFRGTFARRSAMGTHPAAGTTSSGSVLRARFPPGAGRSRSHLVRTEASIVDVEAIPARTYDEVEATKTMRWPDEAQGQRLEVLYDGVGADVV